MTTQTFTSIEPCTCVPSAARSSRDMGDGYAQTGDVLIDGLSAETPTFDLARANELADRVLALKEPWGGRFFAYVASRAAFEGYADEGHLPLRARLAGWLLDRRLDALVRALLRAWSMRDDR